MSHLFPMTCGGTRRGIRGVSRAGLFFFFARRRSRGGSRGERSRVARRRPNLAAREASTDDHRARRDDREAWRRTARRSSGADRAARSGDAEGQTRGADLPPPKASVPLEKKPGRAPRAHGVMRCRRAAHAWDGPPDNDRRQYSSSLHFARARVRPSSGWTARRVGARRRGRVAPPPRRPGRSRASRVSARRARPAIGEIAPARLLRAVRLADDARAARDADALFRAVLGALASLPAPLADDVARAGRASRPRARGVSPRRRARRRA